jgi:hypothetical protein
MADIGEVEKRSGAAVFPQRRCAPMVGGGLEVLLQHQGSWGMRRGQRGRTAMTESVSSPQRGGSTVAAVVLR